MARIEQTRLPGIGVRYDFVTADGTRIGMVSYDAGGRELLIYARRDPDECRATVALAEEDARALSHLLGGAPVIEDLGRHGPDPAS